MTDLAKRRQIVDAYKEHQRILKKNRRTGEVTECTAHPSSWNWGGFEYLVGVEPTPVELLRAEVEQACRDGEAVILTQDAGRELLEYLESR